MHAASDVFVILIAGQAVGCLGVSGPLADVRGPQAFRERRSGRLKQTQRLIEAVHRVAERHADTMAVALTAAEARRIVAGGRPAVFLGVESGFDHDGDPDVLRALYRLGLRVVQFSTQTCFNAFADSEADGAAVWHGINSRGRELVAAMNRAGMPTCCQQRMAERCWR